MVTAIRGGELELHLIIVSFELLPSSSIHLPTLLCLATFR
jgi:hypothetical protein